MVFIATPYHKNTVAARIVDDKSTERTLILSDSYVTKFRNNFEDPNDFNWFHLKTKFIHVSTNVDSDFTKRDYNKNITNKTIYLNIFQENFDAI